MAIDNSLYDSLEQTYHKIKEYLDTTQLQREHSLVIIKQEALADVLESFDIEALEEQSKNIDALHQQLDSIKLISLQIIQDLNDVSDCVKTTENLAKNLDTIFLQIKSITV